MKHGFKSEHTGRRKLNNNTICEDSGNYFQDKQGGYILFNKQPKELKKK